MFLEGTSLDHFPLSWSFLEVGTILDAVLIDDELVDEAVHSGEVGVQSNLKKHITMVIQICRNMFFSRTLALDKGY